MSARHDTTTTHGHGDARRPRRRRLPRHRQGLRDRLHAVGDPDRHPVLAGDGQGAAEPGITALVILGFAAVQMVVHMIYFLHMNAKVEGGWTMLALIFTAALVRDHAGRLDLGHVPPEHQHDAGPRRRRSDAQHALTRCRIATPKSPRAPRSDATLALVLAARCWRCWASWRWACGRCERLGWKEELIARVDAATAGRAGAGAAGQCHGPLREADEYRRVQLPRAASTTTAKCRCAPPRCSAPATGC